MKPKVATQKIDISRPAVSLHVAHEIDKVIAKLNRKVTKAGIPSSTLTVNVGPTYQKRRTTTAGAHYMVDVTDLTITGELAFLTGIEIVAFGRRAAKDDGYFIDTVFAEGKAASDATFEAARERATAGECDHCGNRARNRYVFVRNVETGEVGAYGANCLQHYVGRNEAKVAQEIYKCFPHIDEMIEEDEQRESYGPATGADRAYEWSTILRWTWMILAQNPWVSGSMKATAEASRQSGDRFNSDHLLSTKDRVLDAMYALDRIHEAADTAKRNAVETAITEALDRGLSPTEANDLLANLRADAEEDKAIEMDALFGHYGVTEDSLDLANDEVAKVREWLLGEADTDNEYLATLRSQAEMGWVSSRRLGFAVSALNSYRRSLIERDKAESKVESQFVGTVGEKITFEGPAEFVKVVDGDFGHTNLIKVNADGNIIVMFTAAKWAWDVNEGDVVNITATVKRHGLYRDDKQTTVNRPKLNSKKQQEVK